MWESFKQIFNVGWRRDNIKTTFEKNVDNYIKTEDIKGNLNMGRIRRHFSRPTSKEIELYRSHIKSSQEERKLYYDELKNIYKLHIEGRSWLKIEEPVIWLNDINTGYKEKEMLNDPKVSEVMWNIKHGRIYTDTLWVIGKNKRFGENVEIKEIVNKLLEIETRNRGISSMYIPKQKPTNIEPISTNINPEIINTEPKVIDSIEATNTNIVDNIAGSDASKIGLPVGLNKSNVRTESTEESTETKVVEASAETENEKDIEVSSTVVTEDASTQILIIDYNKRYWNHFAYLISKYSKFDGIPKEELNVIYNSLYLCENGILAFNKIVHDALNASDVYKILKIKGLTFKNLSRIYKMQEDSLKLVILPNIVVEQSLEFLPILVRIRKKHKDFHYAINLFEVDSMVKKHFIAKHYFAIKYINGLFLSRDFSIYPKVNNALLDIKSVHNWIRDSYRANEKLIVMLEKLLNILKHKKLRINMNNVCLHLEYWFTMEVLINMDDEFYKQTHVYFNIVKIWRKTISITEKIMTEKNENILSRATKLEDMNRRNEAIIGKAAKYQKFENKLADLYQISNMTNLVKIKCTSWYHWMARMVNILEKIVGGSDDN